MADTQTLQKEIGMSATILEAPSSEGKELVAAAVQDVNNIVPVRPGFVDESKDAELKGQALEIIQAVMVNPADASVTVQVYGLGSEFMQDNTEKIGLMDAKIGDVLKEIEIGSPVNKSLTEIKTQLDLVNPAVVAQTEHNLPRKGIFSLVARMVSRLPVGNEEVLLIINKRKDTVATTIEGLKRHLWAERDKALMNATEMGVISNKLFETQRDLQETVYVGQMIWEGLNAALLNEADPVRSQVLRTLINDLALQVVDIQTVDALNVQSRMSAETLIANARKIQQGVSRVTNVLLPAVSINLMVKAAAAQQAALVGAMGNITRSAEQTILDTSKQTRTVAVSMERMQSEGMINPATLQAAANEVISMIGEIEQIRNETEKKARATSKALNEVSDKMRRYADPLTNARHAFEQARENN